MSDTDLTIIIANWNGEAVISDCLKSIVQNIDFPGVEVIVFDNGSEDGSVEIIETYRKLLDLKVIRSSVNIGFAGACNKAASISSAPFLFLLNSDARLTGGFRHALTYLKDHPNIAVCQGPLLTASGRHIDSVGSLISRSGFLYHIAIGQTATNLPESRQIFSAKGAAMFVRKGALGDLGLFDEDAFAYFEETDLCWRLGILGWDIAYVRDLPPVVHQGGYSAKRLPNSFAEYHSFKNRFRSILKNADGITLITMIPLHMFITIVGCAEGLAKGSPQRMISVARALGWNIRHLRRTIAIRRIVQRGRRRRDDILFEAVGTSMALGDFLSQRAAYRRAQYLSVFNDGDVDPAEF